MGLMNLIRRSGSDAGAGLLRLPSGSYTVDPAGKVVASTLPRSFPAGLIQDITGVVLGYFRASRESHRPMSELAVDYAALRLTARELRGGAIIFLAPRVPGQK